MSILVLAVEKPYWQDVLIKLTERGLPITAAVVHYRYKTSPKKFFKHFQGIQIDGKLFYRVKDVSRLLKQQFNNDFPPLSEEIIKHFEPIERDYYILSDRFAYFPRSFRYRKRLFRESIRYWLAFFEHHQIKAVFNSCTPHNFSDFTAYHVAKYLGIPTTLIAHSMLNDYVLVRNDYTGNDKVPAGFMVEMDENEIKQHIPEKLYDAAFSESNVLKLVIQKNDESQGVKDLNVKEKKKLDLAKIGKKFLRRLVRSARFLFIPPVFKGALAMNGLYPPSVRRVLRLFNRFWQIRQWAYHNRVAVTPDLSKNYIYFAMHLQPERTSTPEAETFEDQLVAIEILSRALPAGWKLYVKENPRQFARVNILKGKHMRDKTDYQDILRLPNVSIIRQDVPTRELIRNAQIVSTLSGSIGWESLQSGKPCIVFANAWYVECNSCIRIGSVNEAKDAIAILSAATEESIKIDVLRYLAYMQDKYIIGCMGEETYLRAANIPYEELVGSMVERLELEFKKYI